MEIMTTSEIASQLLVDYMPDLSWNIDKNTMPLSAMVAVKAVAAALLTLGFNGFLGKVKVSNLQATQKSI